MHNKTYISWVFFSLFFVTTNSFSMIQKTAESSADKPVTILKTEHDTMVGGSAFLLQNKKIISVNGFSEINMWNPDSDVRQKIGWNFEKDCWQRNYSVVFSPNKPSLWQYFSVGAVNPTGTFIAFAGSRRRIDLWDIETLCSPSEMKPLPIAVLSGHTNQITSLKFTPSGMLLSTSWDHTVILWYYNLFEKNIVPKIFDVNVDSAALCADITPNENVIFSGYFDGYIRIWSVFSENNKLNDPLEFKAHNGPVRTVLVSSDGKFLISGSNDGLLKVWDLLANCKPVTSINLCCRWILSLLQLDTNHFLVGCKNGVVRMLQSNDNKTWWKIIKNLPCGNVGIVSMHLSASKEFIVVTDEAGKIYVWKNPLFVNKIND